MHRYLQTGLARKRALKGRNAETKKAAVFSGRGG